MAMIHSQIAFAKVHILPHVPYILLLALTFQLMNFKTNFHWWKNATRALIGRKPFFHVEFHKVVPNQILIHKVSNFHVISKYLYLKTTRHCRVSHSIVISPHMIEICSL